MFHYFTMMGYQQEKKEERFALYIAKFTQRAKFIITEEKEGIVYMYLYDENKEHINTYAKIGNEVGSVYRYRKIPKLAHELLKNNKIAKEVL